LRSKPTWSNAYGRTTTSVFLLLTAALPPEIELMKQSTETMAQQIAQAAIAFQERRTGHTPKSVSVVFSQDTLVVSLHGALSPAEQALVQSHDGAARMQEFHRELFQSDADPLCREIKRITGVDVREAAAEVEPASGTVVQVFTSGTMVQIFSLSEPFPAQSWSGNGNGKTLPVKD